jgi:predicted GNAT family N-acyltransferase
VENVKFVPYQAEHFSAVQDLNKAEGWKHLVERNEETKAAWDHSSVAYVVLKDETVAGYIRGFTDRNVTIYICEMLISQSLRGSGIGGKLLRFVHARYPRTRMEMLASSSSYTFYESQNFRPFYGFRKTFEE